MSVCLCTFLFLDRTDSSFLLLGALLPLKSPLMVGGAGGSGVALFLLMLLLEDLLLFLPLSDEEEMIRSEAETSLLLDLTLGSLLDLAGEERNESEGFCVR